MTTTDTPDYLARLASSDLADMDIGDVEIEHREIIARCREEQKRWQEDGA